MALRREIAELFSEMEADIDTILQSPPSLNEEDNVAGSSTENERDRELKDARERIREQESQYREALEGLRTRCKQLESNEEQFRQQQIESHEKLEKVTIEKERLERELHDSNRKSECLQAEKKAFATSMKDKLGQWHELAAAEEEKLQEKLNFANQQLLNSLTKNSKLDREINELEKKLRTANGEITASQTQVQTLQFRSEATQQKISQMENELEEKANALRDKSQQHQALEEEKSNEIIQLNELLNQQQLSWEGRLQEMEEQVRKKNELLTAVGNTLIDSGKEETKDVSMSSINLTSTPGPSKMFSALNTSHSTISPVNNIRENKSEEERKEDEEEEKQLSENGEGGETLNNTGATNSSRSYSLRRRGDHLRTCRLQDSFADGVVDALLTDEDSKSPPSAPAPTDDVPKKKSRCEGRTDASRSSGGGGVKNKNSRKVSMGKDNKSRSPHHQAYKTRKY